MIRDCIDAYKELMETVTGIGTVIPFMRITPDIGQTKTVFGDADSNSINVVLVNYSKVSKFEDEATDAIYSPITLQVKVLQSFVDSADYSGSTQETFDTLLDALATEFQSQQDYVSGGELYNVSGVKEFNLIGESGVADFLGKPCHAVEWEQEIYLYE